MLSFSAGPTVPVAVRAIRIVIADGHGLFRAGLRRLLESEPDLHVVGEAANSHEAIVAAQAVKPDILLLDLCLAGRSGLEALRTLAGPLPRAIVLTAAIDDELAIEALRLGAQGILLKDSAPRLLFECVRTVADGQCWLGHEHVANLVRHFQTTASATAAAAKAGTSDQPRRAPFGLTNRERQVVSAIVDGSTNRDIARRYSLSADTVKHHLTNIFDKCGVSTRLELALFAVHHGLVDTP